MRLEAARICTLQMLFAAVDASSSHIHSFKWRARRNSCHDRQQHTKPLLLVLPVALLRMYVGEIISSLQYVCVCLHYREEGGGGVCTICLTIVHALVLAMGQKQKENTSK